MDVLERIVCRAFGAPDLLTEENQRKSAAAKLLALAGITIVDERVAAYQTAAEAYIAALIEMVRSHEWDPVLGGYPRGWITPLEFERDLLNNAHGTLMENRKGPPPQQEAETIVRAATEQLLAHVRSNLDAVRDCSPK